MEVYSTIERGQLAPVIYSPDAFFSNIAGNLDHFIHNHTGLAPVYRFWKRHSPRSIENFYAANVQKTVPYWHLVTNLFMEGPVLLTLWHGSNAIETLKKIKGASHPAMARKGTIRSQFWCDNPVCNLIHMSDSVDDVIREIAILELSVSEIPAELKELALLRPTTDPRHHIEHSALVKLRTIIIRVLNTRLGIQYTERDLPISGSAIETEQALTSELREIAKLHDVFNKCIEAFLTGQDKAVDLIEDFIPLFPWERFVIQCGIRGRHAWLK